MRTPVLQPRDPLKPAPKVSKRSRMLNPGWDQLIGRYPFRAHTPYQMPVSDIALSHWYRQSIRKYDTVAGETRLRWAFRTRSARDKFVHAFKNQGAVRA